MKKVFVLKKNMQKAIESAKGKLMLVGEHAVVYEYPCMVMAVNKKISVTIQKTKSLDLELPKNSLFVKTAVLTFFKKYKIKSGLNLSTKSDFDSSLGLGSSSAVTVAVIKALSKLFNISLSRSDLFDLAYEVVLKVQGKSSGFDLAAAIYEGVIYYQLGKPTEKLPQRKMPLLVVYSGNKADTKTLVEKVAILKKNNPQKTDGIFQKIGDLVEKSKSAYLKSEWKTLGNLFNQNHKYLIDLGVSTDKLNLLAEKANEFGAFGAKLSGAGGGDCLILLYPQENKEAIIEAMLKNGGKIIDI